MNGLNNPKQRAGDQYPCMMYRATATEEHFVQTTKDDGSPKTWLVVNNYHGHLCDTQQAHTADEAAMLEAEGWARSPAEAHGKPAEFMTDKDREIADLKAQLAATVGGATDLVKRGPGRPPLSRNEPA